MKSFERRIQKLEEQFNTKEKEINVITVLLTHFGSKYEEIHKRVCSYGEGKNCPLYKEQYEEAKKNNHSNFIFITLPCFKDGECPLCIDTSPIPTSQSDKRNKDIKETTQHIQNKNNDNFKKI